LHGEGHRVAFAPRKPPAAPHVKTLAAPPGIGENFDMELCFPPVVVTSLLLAIKGIE